MKKSMEHPDGWYEKAALLTEGYTCADITTLLRESAILSLNEMSEKGEFNLAEQEHIPIHWKHVAAALTFTLKGSLESVFETAVKGDDVESDEISDPDFGLDQEQRSYISALHEKFSEERLSGWWLPAIKM
jgi:SpoVK/Ycf46/Vps4 family AAA+-type ATPase